MLEGEKREKYKKKILNISWSYFYYRWITLPKCYFLFHPFKIYRIYAQFKVHYKYISQGTFCKGKLAKQEQDQPFRTRIYSCVSCVPADFLKLQQEGIFF